MKIWYIIPALLFISFTAHSQVWSWSNNNPVAGTDLVVTVKDLETSENTHIVAYYFQQNELVSSDVNYIREGDALKMTLRVPESNWLRIVVKDEYNDAIAGDHRDVVRAGAPVNANLIDYARATAAYYRVLGLVQNDSLTLDLYRQSITSSPNWLDDPHVISSYYRIAKNASAMKDLEDIKMHVVTRDQATSPLSQDLLISSMHIAKESGDTILYNSLRKKLDESYPQSLVHQQDDLAKFREASAMADRILLREKFKSTYGVSDANQQLYDRMTIALVDDCAELEQYEQMEGYIKEIMDPATRASVCNNYAWDFAGGGLEEDPSNLDLAHDLSSISLMTLTPDLKKPVTMSQSEWERSLNYDKAMYGDTYALILYRQGKYDEAIAYQESAVKTMDHDDMEMNERYVVYLDKAGKKEAALSFAEEMIRQGKATRNIKTYHEQIWTKEKTHDQLYDQYITSLEAAAKAERKRELQKSWLETSAIPFTLQDIDGKSVLLDQYKGKTVVLDFWATWCGPCVASFPGMKDAVQYYANDKDVVFLFVNTFEKADDLPGMLRKFMQDNDYPFHVVMDKDRALAEQYKVEGIPTKFVIGPDQKIRFKSVGFSGSNEQLVEELITMIDMARQGGPSVSP